MYVIFKKSTSKKEIMWTRVFKNTLTLSKKRKGKYIKKSNLHNSWVTHSGAELNKYGQ